MKMNKTTHHGHGTIEFDVRQWLRTIGMADYTQNFVENGYTSFKVCSNLDSTDLREMGISLLGHIKELLLHSQDLRSSSVVLHNPKYFSLQGVGNLRKSVPLPPPITVTSSSPGHHQLKVVSPGASPRDLNLNREKRQLTESYHKRAVFKTREPERNDNIEFLLVRHGESEANVDSDLYSTVADHAVKLSNKGESQAKAAGEQIKNYFEQTYGNADKSKWKCRIWTSTYKRARQTAQFIKEAAGDWVTDIKESIFLVEQQFGLFEGVNWANGSVDEIFPQELKHYNKCATFGGRFWARVPMGESRFDVCRRVYHTLQPIREDNFDHVIIVSHGVTLRAFVMCYFNKTPEWFEEEPNPINCSIKLITKTKEESYIWPREEDRKKETVPDSDLLLIKDQLNQLNERMIQFLETRKLGASKENL
jgi:broad specificity phosphatase PhoE